MWDAVIKVNVGVSIDHIELLIDNVGRFIYTLELLVNNVDLFNYQWVFTHQSVYMA